jgi:pimeloyl-ACP methyl ester carboxylesterase
VHAKKLGAVAAAALALAAGLTASSAAGSSSSRAKSNSAKPTIVLVHGAWADSGSWDQVVSRLQRAGYTVSVPPNPLEDLTTDSQRIASFLQSLSGPIVLVGHSYGGAVITNAATGNAQVKALVYEDAFIPDAGQALMQLVHGGCFAVADLSTVFNFVPIPGAPAADVDAYVKPSVFPRCFAAGLPARQQAVLAATQRPLATAALGAPSGTPAWKAIRSWAIVGTQDQAVPLADQLAMAKHAGARITRVRAPHLSMVTDPDVVARVIQDAARATR